MRSKKKLVALVLVFVLAVTSLSGCAWLDSKIADMKGELIGNSFDISIYDNFGTNILNISGDKVQVDANIVEVQSVDSSGNWSTTYEMSSVTSNTIDGNNMRTRQVTQSFMQKEVLKRLLILNFLQTLKLPAVHLTFWIEISIILRI